MNRPKLFLMALLLGNLSCSTPHLESTHESKNSYRVSSDEATQIALQFYQQNQTLQIHPNYTPAEIMIDSLSIQQDKPTLYVAHYPKLGFALISADKRREPVLGYSPQGTFSTDKRHIPLGLVEWIAALEDQDLYDQPEYTQLHLKNQWKYWLLPDTVERLEVTACEEKRSIQPPLLETQWHQNCGFNDALQPMDCNVPCGRAYAGCVPVAIAQTMNYHQHPKRYAWNRMEQKLGTPETADLIKDIHTSIGALTYKCEQTGLDRKFDLAPILKRDFNYTHAQSASLRKDLLIRELKEQRPVILSGGKKEKWLFLNSYKSGHMWVCDGFRQQIYCLETPKQQVHLESLYLHMNWGWENGRYNGWYAFHQFNPADKLYNFKLKMLYNIRP